jgi:heat shock protein HslJ
MVLFLAACGTDRGGIPTVLTLDNRTGTDITVIWEREADDPVEHGRIPNGEKRIVEMYPYGNSRDFCGDGDLVALDSTGREVSRRSATCDPWVIRVTQIPMAEITDRRWVRESFSMQGEPAKTSTDHPTLVIRSDMMLSFWTGCRTLEGRYGISEQALLPRDLGVVEGLQNKDCPEALKDQDAAMSELLGRQFEVASNADALVATSKWLDTADWRLDFAPEP